MGLGFSGQQLVYKGPGHLKNNSGGFVLSTVFIVLLFVFKVFKTGSFHVALVDLELTL